MRKAQGSLLQPYTHNGMLLRLYCQSGQDFVNLQANFVLKRECAMRTLNMPGPARVPNHHGAITFSSYRSPL